MRAKILYFDMDNVLVDFASGIARLPQEIRKEYEGRLDDVPGIFALMRPVDGAIEAFNRLTKLYDTYILSTAPWNNPSAWSDKLLWVKKHLGSPAYKRLTLTHHKNLAVGDYLIDDRIKHGVDKFQGKHIHFGSAAFPDWASVVALLTSEAA